MVLHVIRCGETTWEGERRLAGSTDLPLSEHGREAVVALTRGWPTRTWACWRA